VYFQLSSMTMRSCGRIMVPMTATSRTGLIQYWCRLPAASLTNSPVSRQSSGANTASPSVALMCPRLFLINS
jgi:hypothetical protein